MTCSICTHPNKDEINHAIVRGDSQRVIASRFGISQASVGRHKEHIRNLITQDEELQADMLAHEVKGLQKVVIDILEDALASKDKRAALQAIKEARSNIELIAKLTGAIDERIKVAMESEDSTVRVVYVNDWKKKDAIDVE